MRHALRAFAAVIACLATLSVAPRPSIASCPDIHSVGNVTWTFTDQITACPAGETTSVSGHPSRLRVLVTYQDADCNARVGVPPESLYITWATHSGNAKINDKTTYTYADDSTNYNGQARFTFPSLSGYGQVRIALNVSGDSQGHDDVSVRSLDINADGRVTVADTAGTNDVNWAGGITSADKQLILDHIDHWTRNALHGTLVRRTNFSETSPEYAVNTIGEGRVSWSPSNRFLAHTAFVTAYPDSPTCKVFMVPSSPSDGNALLQFTSSSATWPLKYHDYDPNWSATDEFIVFDRGDSAVISRQVPWSGSTAEAVITSSDSCGLALHGDDVPSLSPDGLWVAFSRCNTRGGWSLWKIKVDGTGLTQLTTASQNTDFYSTWSPDGQTITFQRNRPNVLAWKYIMTIPAAGGDTAVAVALVDSFDTVQPTYAADGLIMLVGRGKRSFTHRQVVTTTLDPSLAPVPVAKLIANYPDTTFAENSDFPVLMPLLSPDGTRLALKSKQIWAARRNMNLPGKFTTLHVSRGGGAASTVTLDDTTATYDIGLSPYEAVAITLDATDPESNALTFDAAYLVGSMSFNPSTHYFSWASAGAAGGDYTVKFRVKQGSGGTDAILVRIGVRDFLGASSSAVSRGKFGTSIESKSLSGGGVSVHFTAPRAMIARLSVFDVTGRRVADLTSRGGENADWSGRGAGASRSSSGVYWYRAQVGDVQKTGKVILVR